MIDFSHDFIRFASDRINNEAEITLYVNHLNKIIIEADNPRLTCLALSRTLSCDEVKQLVDYLNQFLETRQRERLIDHED